MRLIHFPEPALLFRHGQAIEDPRDGLTLFGPLDKGAPYGIRAGVIGSADGLRRFRDWAAKIQRPVVESDSDELFQLSHPPYPGFEAAFRIPWSPAPVLELEINRDDVNKSLFLSNKHQRVYKTVDLYADRILRALKDEDVKVDVWFVLVHDDVYKYCRPESRVPATQSIFVEQKLTVKEARRLETEPSLFPDVNVEAKPYQYEPNFHNQLKARLLGRDAPTQIIRESTIAHRESEFLNTKGNPRRKLDSLQSRIAWNISNAAFYKAGGRPWKIAQIRRGVCYIGLAFKQDGRGGDPRSACCAAQMFLDSGDGVVFKGAVGPWYSPKRGEFHLSRQAASRVVNLAVGTYKDDPNNKERKPPAELFLHGRTAFNDDEWAGFQDAIDRTSTNLVGVRIKTEKMLKLYRGGSYPILRGLAHVQDRRTAYLWTSGFVPRVQTYDGKEVPRPLLIDVCRGDGVIETILADIMALTKLNYNACRFGGGSPVTLRFADAVGEILTAGPAESDAPLSFKYYI
ncbi:MAG TPA: hypothetical protein VEU62_07080 [Bryobacterales bacterium]|nr:hypothetical protein [Bryobacterales bacterium]